MSLRVALLFGGRSTEHEVSVRSARAVARALASAQCDVVPIGIDGDGRWLEPSISQEILDSTAERVASAVAREVMPDTAGRGLWIVAPSGRTPVKVDVVFPLVHGWGGEDGRIQGALDLAGLPYAGGGVLASSTAMNKSVSKELLHQQGLLVSPWICVQRDRVDDDLLEANAFCERVGYPVFVKPANGGSSVGIHKVGALDQLPSAVRDALRYDPTVIVEQGIDAREIECAVLGNDPLETSVLGEVVAPDGFYDYASKYLDDSAGLVIPADLPPRLAEEIRALAMKAFRAHRLCGFARVDFLVERGSDRVFVNELNTLPGFTSISMYPKLWAATGVEFPELVRRIVTLAVDQAVRGKIVTAWDGAAS